MIEWNTALQMGLEEVEFIGMEKMDVDFANSGSYEIQLAKDTRGNVQYHATVSVDDESGHLLTVFYEYGKGLVSYPDLSDFFTEMKDRFPKS